MEQIWASEKNKNTNLGIFRFDTEQKHFLGKSNKIFRKGASFWKMSPEEFEKIKNINLNQNLEIQDGDKILFDKSVVFPKTFVKEIPTINRTIKQENANKIIVLDNVYNDLLNCPNSIFGFLHQELRYGGCYRYRSFIAKEDLNGQTTTDFFNFVDTSNSGVLEEGYLIPRNFNESFISISQKIIPFSKFIKYNNSKLPKIADKDTFLALLMSDNESQNKLAIDMFKMYDLSNVIFDVFYCLVKRNLIPKLSKTTLNSINFKYFLSVLNTNRTELKNCKWYLEDNCKIIGELYSNEMMNEEQKLKSRVYLQLLLHKNIDDFNYTAYQKEVLELYNIPLTYDDTDGKATACYREMEEKWRM